VRLYEAIAGGVHERAASAALKIQAATEATSTGKLAAIAASAAAIAGGGAAVVNGAADTDPHDAARAVQPASVASPAPVRAAVASGRSTATAPVRRTRVRRPPQREFAAARRQGPATTTASRNEFAATSTTASAPATTTTTVVRSGSPEPSASSREFASEFGG
jgi:hypothetical protein